MAKRPPLFGCRAAPRRSWATTRTSRHRRGYGWEWEKQRARVLRDEPMCRLCLARGRPVPATEVDHIVPKALGGSDNDGNLQPLCSECHKAKTSKEASARRQ